MTYRVSDNVDKHWKARVLMCLGRAYARGFHRLDVRTPCPLPKSGAAILVCNHISGLDPVLIQSACGRLITWMMAREYYELPAMRWGFEAIGAIPVDRSGRDFAATRSALRALQRGQVLGMFPEGKIEPDRRLLPFQTGAAMIAHRSAAPLFVAYIDGTQRRATDMLAGFVNSQSATLTFGPEVRLDFGGGRPDLDKTTERIQAAVERLR